MLQKIKIFVIVVICSIFTINIATAQDKKVFDNVGVYFYPMIDINYSKFYYDGWSTGLRSNVKVNNKFSLDFGFGYGREHYKSLNKRTIDGIPILLGYYANSIKSKTIRIDPKLRYIVSNSENNNYFYAFGGTVLNIRLYEIYEITLDESNLIKENETINLHDVLFDLGLGYSYQINPNFSLNVEISTGIPLWINYYKVLDVANKHPSNINGGIILGLFYKW